MPYTLYNLYGSPPCATVRMLAKHIGVDLELKNVDPFKREHLTPEYLKLNPFHKVPTFSDDGFIIYESSAICYYLLRKHAPSSDLYPDCPRTRARVDQALATITSTIQPHYFKFFRPRFYELTKPTPEDVEQFEENVIKGFEHVLREGNYVLGDKLSLADLSLVAHLTLVFEVPFLNGDKYPKLKALLQPPEGRIAVLRRGEPARNHRLEYAYRRSEIDAGDRNIGAFFLNKNILSTFKINFYFLSRIRGTFFYLLPFLGGCVVVTEQAVGEKNIS
nr:glutathione S-transferase 1-like [Rhipicephalus microplus]